MSLSPKSQVICLVGPTASGKTELAIELAQRINAEIISADSMQVYRGMDILSAKPTKAQRKLIPHHLIDILNPEEEYSAAIFAGLAGQHIKEILQRGNVPLIVGGTGLYVRALVHGLFEEKGKDEKLRQELQQRADAEGNDSLFKELKKVDPETALTIDPHNDRRLIRALEVFYVNHVPLSELKKQAKGIAAQYEVKMFGISRERDELYARIDKRVEQMFSQGIVEEVKKLIALPLSKTALQALGIKQIQGYLKGAYSLEESQDLLKRDTRHFAKRQMTWFGNKEKVQWISVTSHDSIPDVAARLTNNIPA